MADETDPPKKSPHDALIEALEHVEEMQDVLVVYREKERPGEKVKCGSFDSDLTLGQSLYLMELFRHWFLVSVMGK